MNQTRKVLILNTVAKLVKSASFIFNLANGEETQRRRFSAAAKSGTVF